MATIEQLKNALIGSHKAGDTQASIFLAKKIKEMQGGNIEQQPQPMQQEKPLQAQPIQGNTAVMNGKEYQLQDFTDAQKKELENFKTSGATQGESSPYRDYSPYNPLGYVDMAMSDMATSAPQLGAYGLKALGKGADYLASKVGYNPDLENKLDYTGKFDKVAQGQETDFQKNYGTGLTPALLRGGAGIVTGAGLIGGAKQGVKQVLKSGIKSKIAGAGNLVKSSAIGAGLTPYVTTDKNSGDLSSFAERKAIDTAVGTTLGGLGKGASVLTSKVADDIIPLAKRAKEFGIKLRVDQIKPTRFRKTVQKISQDIPFSGVDAQEATQKTQWNTALAKTLGNGITDTTPESINKFSQLNSAKYDKVLKNTKINVFQDDVSQLQQQVNYVKDNVSPLQFKKIDNVLKSVIDDFNQGLDGVDFKAVSAIKINGLRRDLLDIASKSQGDAKNTIAETADFVHDILNKSLPKNKQKLLQEANQEYKNFKTIQPLLEKSTTGEINPTDLLNRVASSKYITASKQNVGKDALVDLARIGKQFLPKAGGSDTFAKSATAGVAGASVFSPKTLLTVTGGGALNRLGQSINKSPSNVAKHLSGDGFLNKSLNGISNNADTIASQSSRMTGQAMNAMTNKQDAQQQNKVDLIKEIRARRQTSKPTSNNIDLINEIRQRRLQNKPQASNESPLMDKFSNAESSGNINAKSSVQGSTAQGLFGFTDDTWKRAVNKFGKQYNVSINDRNDREAQTAMALALTNDNKRIANTQLGRNVNDTEAYALHFMGAGQGVKFIKILEKNPNGIAKNIFPKEARYNKEIFYNEQKPRTIAEVYRILQKKVS